MFSLFKVCYFWIQEVFKKYISAPLKVFHSAPALIGSMRELFRHVKLDPEEPDTVLTITSWLDLLHDPNRVVSFEFCSRLDVLASVFESRDDIENKCHKVCGLFV